jgi:hypothetical protein
VARALQMYRDTGAAVEETTRRQRIDRSTARALAAAISSLAIATLVVTQSSRALYPEGTVAANEFASGTVSLSDDDQGRSLVSLENMAPNRPVQQCISVTYDGTILPVAIRIAASASGDVADYLLVDVERGSGGGFGDCDGFVPEADVFVGRVGEFAGEDGVELGVLRNEGDSMSFRFTFDLADENDAAGRSGSIDFVWEAAPL